MVDVMSKKDERGFDVFNPANVAPMVVFLSTEEASRISGEVFRVVGDSVFVFQGWHSFNVIKNEGKPFTPQILAQRVKTELLKGLPRKETLMDIVGSMIKM
jgi:hypothetical protein